MVQFHQEPHPDEYGINRGGMIALLPDPYDAGDLAHAAGLDPRELHLTLAYLGDDVTRWPMPALHAVREAARNLLAGPGPAVLPLNARAFAHATFNPDHGPDGDRDPCAVYLIGDTPDLEPLRDRTLATAGAYLAAAGVTLPEQHAPFVPHMTAGEGLTAGSLHYVGPVRFNRLVLALGPDWIEVTA